MDVVADAGAVRGGVVVAVYGDEFPCAEGNLEDDRDEMGFRVVGFADCFVRMGTGGVEVAEAGGAEAPGLFAVGSTCSIISFEWP